MNFEVDQVYIQEDDNQLFIRFVEILSTDANNKDCVMVKPISRWYTRNNLPTDPREFECHISRLRRNEDMK